MAAPAVLLQRLAGLSACERHDYDWSRDRGFRDLEALMTGPLVDTAAAGVRGLLASGRVSEAPQPCLCVILAAPITAINAALEKHETLARSVDLGWLKLFAAYDDAAIVLSYAGNLHWEAMSGQDAA